jgi:hypothetical protein
MVAMLFTLGGMAYLKNMQIYKPFPQISDMGMIGGVMAQEGDNGKKAFMELADMASNEETPFLFASYFVIANSAAVYYSDPKMLPIELTEGRMFSEQDFSSNADVVLINSERRNECNERDGALWWNYAGEEYEVIGIYNSPEDNAVDAFYNLTADSLSSDMFGDFVFDAGTESASVFDEIAARYYSEHPNAFIGFVPLSESKGSEYVHEGATAFGAMELMLIATAILVLINAMSVGASWLTWYEKEMSVRMLCGATRRKIQLWIVGKWLSFAAISEVIGILCVAVFLVITKYMPVAESVSLMYGKHIEWKGVSLGFLGLLLLGGIVITVIVLLGNRKTILGGMR